MEQKYFLFVIYFTLINWLVRHGSMDIMDFYIEHLKHIGVLFYSLGKVYISNIIYKHFYFYFNVFYFFKLVLTPPFIDAFGHSSFWHVLDFIVFNGQSCHSLPMKQVFQSIEFKSILFYFILCLNFI